MTIDEAIKHARKVAEENKRNVISIENNFYIPSSIDKDTLISACIECAEEHEQLAEWLEELKAKRESENDTCKYSIKDNLVFVGCTNKSIASTFAYYNELDDYKYCPYCGKKIKI